jgi:signal transduction histidine kinase
VLGLTAPVGMAAAQTREFPIAVWLDTRNAIGLAVLLGIVIFATTLAILHIRERRRWTEADAAQAAEIARLRTLVDRSEILLGAERQVVVLWQGPNGEAKVEGDPTVAADGAGPKRVLAFGSWLGAAAAGRLEGELARLRERGEGFRLTLARASGGFVEAEGRTVGGAAILRLRDVSDDRSAMLEASGQAAQAREDLTLLRGLLDAIDAPAWLRRPDGGLAWANRAYCAAVDAAGLDAAVSRSLELLDRSDRDEAARRRARGEIYRARVAAIMAGSRRVLDIIEAPLGPAPPHSAGGLAQDVSELEALRTALARQDQAHVRMLDQLPTAVAMFDSSQRLMFHNASYRRLWGLEAAFLAGGPSDREILERLRADRRLPEQADFRAWIAAHLKGYQSTEPQESWWHLPDRRTLRVVSSPTPQGGLTYLFEDVSDRMHLESRYNALIRTQGETLDALSEGVALFGTDGRLKLFNRALVDLWRVDSAALAGEPHIEAVVALCRPLAPDEGPWSDLRSAVSGLSDMRERIGARMQRLDGSVVDGAAEPLPGGATLLTFADVTATVNVERALTDRNDALELAARLRNEFVHHVSYELRSPLTNIIGFAELLGAETVGPLNERQREYAEHITRSSGALLAIINDILDLASIDTDLVELARDRVDIRDTIEAAATGMVDRLVEAELRLEIDAPAGIGSFTGDAKRVRQVIYNLLSNAAGFSRPGQTIRVTARKEADEISISVADQGRGIDPEVQARVFDRFESRTVGTSHRGVGLGLSIVRSFVELHGGRVELVSERGAGTTVTCFFPSDGRPQGQLAATLREVA